MKKLLLLLFLLCPLMRGFAQSDSESGNNNRSVRQNSEHVSARLTVQEAYPNPAQNEITLEYTLHAQTREAKVVFYNVLGANVAEFDMPKRENKLEISVAKLNPGIYFYTVSADGINEITRRLIVRR